jgi:thiol-disulfide isomerase/thioredoxin
MKKIYFFLFAALLVSCQKTEEKTTDYALFSGKIAFTQESKLVLRNFENNSIKEIPIDGQGAFSDTLKGILPGFYSITVGDNRSTVYLEPGYSLNLEAIAAEFDETLVYSGIGKAENNYLAQKILLQKSLAPVLHYKNLGALDEKVFLSKVDSVYTLQKDLLNKQKDLGTQFVELENGNILYGRANLMYDYESYKRYVGEDKAFKVSVNYPDFHAELDPENEKLAAVNNYKNYWQKYYNKKANPDQSPDDDSVGPSYLNLVSKEVKSPVIKNNLLYAEAKYAITYTNDLENYYKSFMANSSNEVHKKEISETYNKLAKLSKGSPSPTFENYENFAGGSTSLSELKGKYVYIDVWATWCGPCIREIPSLKEQIKKYEGKNIAFMSISVDKQKDHEKWKEMVKEKELQGIQLFAPNDWESTFVKDYSIMGIPRFILIDPNGNIVNANAPKPSDAGLQELLGSLNL